jgi:hypothetical protein
VKKIVDSGGLRTPELESYVSKSTRNFVVITEFATLEMFYGDADVNFRRSLAIIRRFPQQVIILKSNAKISKMTPRPRGLQNRLEDEAKTQDFVKFCRLLSRDGVSNDHLRQNIMDYGVFAHEWRDRFTRQTVSIRAAITNLEKQIAPSDLKALRSGQLASPTFTKQAVRNIMGVTALHFRDVVRADPMPDSEQALFTFPFRYAVCTYALSLKWVMEGGHSNAAEPKLRNDYIDMTYAAYATFFDGLITKDTKLQEVYSASCWILARVFGMKLSANCSPASPRTAA